MRSTTCNLENKPCRIDYEKTPIASGMLYHGTVFQDHILEFFFVIFKNDDPVMFSPLKVPDNKRDAIINAVVSADTHNIDSMVL
ncbi:MAG TPA: hypothetical protein VMT76_01930 [Puia sp.]|nr:hypothetical protein [Puia sp.]